MLQTILHEAVQAGAAQLIHYFNGPLAISEKEGINNLVTEADHASEEGHHGCHPASLSRSFHPQRRNR
ncbi:MAG: hypothetical protein U0T56_08725 [Ferruginibacter sp.]